MVFHLSVGFLEIHEGKKFAVWIGDTVHVSTTAGVTVLTSFVSKGLENVSYELEEEEEEEEEKDEDEKEKKPVVSSQILKDAETVILKERYF